ncbi:APC family permease [Robertkochia aurantiaca]|uniref:APC family permease n=1 Tax=Robertkochia aurantiaca TaxID=2873700 RepID=UPI001CCBC079|nr:APC family permease [Robertkochia sp. 3YJGBD-33]
MSKSNGQLSPAGVWALAAGGMVGGGIYTVLGVAIAVAGQWTWFSFLFTGIIALCSAYSYVFLSNKFSKSGGAFAFLEKVENESLAGGLSWLLILGYILTISVYAYAFGHYISFSFHGSTLIIRILAAAILLLLIGLNLLGVGKLTRVEIVIVSLNLLVLLILGIYGVSNWDQPQLIAGMEPRPFWSGIFGGAAIFMAFEGFQLLSYEYDKIKEPGKYFMPVLLLAVTFVILVYILVALGATFLGGAANMINFKQIALSVAAMKAIGTPGIIVMTIAAGLATAAAINSTLFSTSNLSRKIADKNELPKWFDHTNSHDVPDRAVIMWGTLAAVFAVIGSLSSLVEAASLVFLITFGIVNWLAYKEEGSKKWIPIIGIAFGAITAIALLFRLLIARPWSLAFLLALMFIIIFVRPYILKRIS